MSDQPKTESTTRRTFLRNGARIFGITGLAGLGGVLASRTKAEDWDWQLDPDKCVRCGNCATNCVLEQSAVKCVHAFAMCGYCNLCTGYFEQIGRASCRERV